MLNYRSIIINLHSLGISSVNINCIASLVVTNLINSVLNSYEIRNFPAKPCNANIILDNNF